MVTYFYIHVGISYPGPSDYLPKVNITKQAAPQYSLVGKPKRPDGKFMKTFYYFFLFVFYYRTHDETKTFLLLQMHV
jgi:hypothetical protein